jgi:hypothetical protein
MRGCGGDYGGRELTGDSDVRGCHESGQQLWRLILAATGCDPDGLERVEARRDGETAQVFDTGGICAGPVRCRASLVADGAGPDAARAGEAGLAQPGVRLQGREGGTVARLVHGDAM